MDGEGRLLMQKKKQKDQLEGYCISLGERRWWFGQLWGCCNGSSGCWDATVVGVMEAVVAVFVMMVVVEIIAMVVVVLVLGVVSWWRWWVL